jgi:hypothetical protein
VDFRGLVSEIRGCRVWISTWMDSFAICSSIWICAGVGGSSLAWLGVERYGYFVNIQKRLITTHISNFTSG